MGALYRVGSRLIEAGFAAAAVDLHVDGVEHLPATGPGVLVSNHISYVDFAFVMLAPPRPRREVRFLARAEFFEQPVLGTLMRRLGQIPVDVHGDPMAAAAEARAALDAGQLIGLHPEGTISPSFEVRRGKSGAVRLAEGSGAPIIPVALWGTQRLLTKGRRLRPERRAAVLVRYGEPFVPEGRTAMARTQAVMNRITSMVAELQAAYPQQPDPADPWWLPARLGGSAPTPEEADAHIAEQNARRRAARS